MDLRFDNGPWQIVQGHDLILMRPKVYDVSCCGTQNLQEFRLKIYLTSFEIFAYITFDALKFKPNSVVHYYCVWFDF